MGCDKHETACKTTVKVGKLMITHDLDVMRRARDGICETAAKGKG